MFGDREFVLFKDRIERERLNHPFHKSLGYPEYWLAVHRDINYFTNVAEEFAKSPLAQKPSRLRDKIVIYLKRRIAELEPQIVIAEERRLKEIRTDAYYNRNQAIFARHESLFADFLRKRGGAAYPNPYLYKMGDVIPSTGIINEYFGDTVRLIEQLCSVEGIMRNAAFESNFECHFGRLDWKLSYESFVMQLKTERVLEGPVETLEAFPKLPECQIGLEFLERLCYEEFGVSADSVSLLLNGLAWKNLSDLQIMLGEMEGMIIKRDPDKQDA